jgi:hypothetical protein
MAAVFAVASIHAGYLLPGYHDTGSKAVAIISGSSRS